MDQLYDPLRKKNVAATPEEQVRQWFIGVLSADAPSGAGIPKHLMMSEAGFKWGDKQYRADILVFDRNGLPLAVVECKRPDVEISAAVAEQALRYNAVLDVRYIFLTNGRSTIALRRNGDSFAACKSLPHFEEMCGQ